MAKEKEENDSVLKIKDKLNGKSEKILEGNAHNYRKRRSTGREFEGRKGR